jgi:Zn-dependent peptidase ImmA (M78 family)
MNHQPNIESTLGMMRALVPRRRLTHSESLRIAELQANRLLEHFEITDDRVPSEIVTEFPRVEVRYEHDLPVSGSTHWEAGRWIVTLNADESSARRRFSLMHEFKHILDHTTKQYLYGDTDEDDRAADRAERVADHFAACLLMPKRRLKGLWFRNRQQLSTVAFKLGVSTRALSVRLYYLGLAPESQRCSRTASRRDFGKRNPTRYFRRTSSQLEAVA